MRILPDINPFCYIVKNAWKPYFTSFQASFHSWGIGDSNPGQLD